MPRRARPPLTEAEKVARTAKLRYVSDEIPGIQRERTDDGFSYRATDGKIIRNKDEITRIEKIAIPPAWEEVWICPYPNGHILAVGRDEKGRKQYRYHPDWSNTRRHHKFDHMAIFAAALPTLRKTAAGHLRQSKPTREKVLALVVTLLETTLIRIGNREYARHNHSFGLTTLRDKHVKISGDGLTFQFKGKSGVQHIVNLNDKRLARAIKTSRDLPGEMLFQYLDENGDAHPITSTDVNDYVRDITGQDFTAKDFRTWGASVYMLDALSILPPTEDEREIKGNITATIKEIARLLGNTPTVCRNYYVHPAILEVYAAGQLREVVNAQSAPKSDYGLSLIERALVEIIEENAG